MDFYLTTSASPFRVFRSPGLHYTPEQEFYRNTRSSSKRNAVDRCGQQIFAVI